MNDFEKIEDLLLTKRYEELSSAELKEVNEYFESSSEYNDMRDTLMQVKSTLAADKLLIKPPVDMKENLLNHFQQTYPNAAPGKIPFYKKAAFQWSAAASVVLLLSLGTFGVLQNMGGNKQKNMAVNYEPEHKEQQSAATADTTVSYSTAVGESGSVEKSKTGPNGYVTQNDVEQTEESEKPVIQSNYYATESTVTEGESYNDVDDVKVNSQQEMKDESDKNENKSLELNKENQWMNTTIPQNSIYNSTNDNTTIDQKARITYQNKKKDKKGEEDKSIEINQGGLTNTSILGNTTTKTEMVLDSLKTDTNIDQLNRRALDTQKADSLEKQN